MGDGVPCYGALEIVGLLLLLLLRWPGPALTNKQNYTVSSSTYACISLTALLAAGRSAV